MCLSATAEMRDQQPNTQKGNCTDKYINQNTRNTLRNYRERGPLTPAKQCQLVFPRGGLLPSQGEVTEDRRPHQETGQVQLHQSHPLKQRFPSLRATAQLSLPEGHSRRDFSAVLSESILSSIPNPGSTSCLLPLN